MWIEKLQNTRHQEVIEELGSVPLFVKVFRVLDMHIGVVKWRYHKAFKR
jgi:hypothetical protein